MKYIGAIRGVPTHETHLFISTIFLTQHFNAHENFSPKAFMHGYFTGQ